MSLETLHIDLTPQYTRLHMFRDCTQRQKEAIWHPIDKLKRPSRQLPEQFEQFAHKDMMARRFEVHMYHLVEAGIIEGGSLSARSLPRMRVE